MHTSVPTAAAIAAGVLSLIVTAQAQQTRAPVSKPNTAVTGGATVHIEGCVFPKRSLGTTTRVTAPPEGSTEPYVLTNTTVIALAPGIPFKEGQTIEIHEDDQNGLRALVGKHVGVTGRLENNDGASRLRVTSIVETVGECPVVPPRS